MLCMILDKFNKLPNEIKSLIIIPSIVIPITSLFIYLILSVTSVDASPSLKTEFSTHRHIDKELGIVCYTTYLIENEEIKDFSMDCLALPPVYDYSERKLYVQNRTNNQD